MFGAPPPGVVPVSSELVEPLSSELVEPLSSELVEPLSVGLVAVEGIISALQPTWKLPRQLSPSAEQNHS